MRIVTLVPVSAGPRLAWPSPVRSCARRDATTDVYRFTFGPVEGAVYFFAKCVPACSEGLA